MAMEIYIKAIYRILQALDKCLDYEKADIALFSAKALGISERRWENYLLMLQNAGYITGVSFTLMLGGESVVNVEEIAITLKGLEYLSSNSAMQRVYNAITGEKT